MKNQSATQHTPAPSSWRSAQEQSTFSVTLGQAPEPNRGKQTSITIKPARELIRSVVTGTSLSSLVWGGVLSNAAKSLADITRAEKPQDANRAHLTKTQAPRVVSSNQRQSASLHQEPSDPTAKPQPSGRGAVKMLTRGYRRESIELRKQISELNKPDNPNSHKVQEKETQIKYLNDKTQRITETYKKYRFPPSGHQSSKTPRKPNTQAGKPDLLKKYQNAKLLDNNTPKRNPPAAPNGESRNRSAMQNQSHQASNRPTLSRPEPEPTGGGDEQPNTPTRRSDTSQLNKPEDTKLAAFDFGNSTIDERLATGLNLKQSPLSKEEARSFVEREIIDSKKGLDLRNKVIHHFKKQGLSDKDATVKADTILEIKIKQWENTLTT